MFKATNQFEQYVIDQLGGISEKVGDIKAINLRQNSDLKIHDKRITVNEKNIATAMVKLGFLVFIGTIILNIAFNYFVNKI